VTAQVAAVGYNKTAIFSGPALYESLDSSQTVYSDVVCRGEGPSKDSMRIGKADVSMQPTGDVQRDANGNITGKVYKGYVKVGEYDLAGNLLSSKEFPISIAVEKNFVPNARFFIIDSETTSRNSMGPGSTPPTTGTALDEIYGLMVNKTTNLGAFHFKTPEMSDDIMIQGMDCHSH
jgi:hypothetical protein